jgi:2'-hydroxyisoflavone reductase
MPEAEMKLLIIGGTQFLGRQFVETALAQGHRVTLFNRGQTNPGLYPEVEKLVGDRTTNLAPLRGRTWDAVVDTSGYVPRVVRAAAAMLAGSVGHYTFISSLSVYREFSATIDEHAPVETLDDPTNEEVTGGTYGGLKALCEEAVQEELSGYNLIVRAGLIVGPYDPLNRFRYWLNRIPRGGDVLAPGSPAHPVQLIDARDIAAWALHCAETGVAGVFNTTGPAIPMTAGNVLATIATVSEARPNFVWVSDEFLLSQGVRPLDGVPLWVPPEYKYFFRVDVRKAVGAGLAFRPLAETTRDTLAWLTTPEGQVKPSNRMGIESGLTPGREAELLAEWRRYQ